MCGRGDMHFFSENNTSIFNPYFVITGYGLESDMKVQHYIKAAGQRLIECIFFSTVATVYVLKFRTLFACPNSLDKKFRHKADWF